MHLCGMIRNFTAELAGTQFRFNTLSSTTLHAFQVYMMQAGKQLRFHMQRKENDFFITDRSICSEEILALEADLSVAILTNQDKSQA